MERALGSTEEFAACQNQHSDDRGKHHSMDYAAVSRVDGYGRCSNSIEQNDAKNLDAEMGIAIPHWEFLEQGQQL